MDINNYWYQKVKLHCRWAELRLCSVWDAVNTKWQCFLDSSTAEIALHCVWHNVLPNMHCSYASTSSASGLGCPSPAGMVGAWGTRDTGSQGSSFLPATAYRRSRNSIFFFFFPRKNNDKNVGFGKESKWHNKPNLQICGESLISCTEKTYVTVVLSDIQNKTRQTYPKSVAFWQWLNLQDIYYLAPDKTSLKSLSNFPLPGFSLSPQSQLLMEDMANEVGHLKNPD